MSKHGTPVLGPIASNVDIPERYICTIFFSMGTFDEAGLE